MPKRSLYKGREEASSSKEGEKASSSTKGKKRARPAQCNVKMKMGEKRRQANASPPRKHPSKARGHQSRTPAKGRTRRIRRTRRSMVAIANAARAGA